MLNHLNNVFPIYTQMLARKLGITVRIGGNDAYFNGEVIQLPSLPLDDREMAEVAWGYVYHEAFHAECSSLEVLRSITNALLEKTFLIVEDLWNEYRQPRKYLTAKKAIDAMNLALMSKGYYTGANVSDGPASVYEDFIHQYGMAYINDLPAMHENADKSEEAFRTLFSDEKTVLIKDLLKTEVPLIESSNDSLRLASLIVKHVKFEDDKAEKPKETTQEAIKQLSSTNKDDFKPDKSNLVIEVLKNTTTSSYRVAAVVPKDAFKANSHLGVTLYKEAKKYSNGIRKELQRVLGNEEAKRNKRRSSGVIDRNRLMQAYLGEQKVYKRKLRQNTKSTSFHIVLDNSSSMNQENRMEIATKAVIALAIGIDSINGAKLGITRFPVTGVHGDKMYQNDVQTLLDENESIHNVAERFGIKANGGTPMESAIWVGLNNLAMSESSRKVLFVITDGLPHDEDAVISVLEKAVEMGVECVGIGISCDSVKKLFDVNSVINNVADLEKALFAITSEMLIAA